MIVVFVLAATMIMAGGCNIFEWTSGEDAETLIAEGRQHMRDAEYDEAAAKFAEAMEEEPDNADARYLHAKAVVHGSGENSLSIAAEIEDNNRSDGDALPFTGSEWPDERANRLYQAVNQAYDDLLPIYNGEATGEIGRDDIDGDLGIVAGVRGCLMFRDTDTNGVINSSDYDLDIEWDVSDDAFAITNFKDFIATASAGVSSRFEPGLAAASPIPASVIGTVNYIIDNIVVIVELARDIITTIATDAFGLDPQEVEDFLNEVIVMAPLYYIDDDADNDGDGLIDEETVDGIDNDGDGLYDEDSNGEWE
jgi:hypothetical protein